MGYIKRYFVAAADRAKINFLPGITADQDRSHSSMGHTPAGTLSKIIAPPGWAMEFRKTKSPRHRPGPCIDRRPKPGKAYTGFIGFRVTIFERM